MKTPLFAILCSVLACSACTIFGPPPQAGQSVDELIARRGNPTIVMHDGNDTLYEYSEGSAGQYTYMARVGKDGKIISYQQVLTLENFALIKPGVTTQEQVLALIGHPFEKTSYARVPFLVWNYGYKEQGVWDSEMSVYFDDTGIVRKLENGPDPRFDKLDPF